MSVFRKSVCGVMALLVGATAAQAQVAALAGSWAQGNANGDIVLGLGDTNLTCNDIWSATQAGKPALPARGVMRFIKAGDVWLIADNNGLVNYDQVAARSMKVTPGAGDTATLEINGASQKASWKKNRFGETILTLTAASGSERIFVQCPILPGRTADTPWTPPSTTYKEYLQCQITSRYLREGFKTANPPMAARYDSYDRTWTTGIGKLTNGGDRLAAAKELDAAFKAMTPQQVQAEMVRLVDHCAGAAPYAPYGLLKAAASAPAPATPSRRK